MVHTNVLDRRPGAREWPLGIIGENACLPFCNTISCVLGRMFYLANLKVVSTWMSSHVQVENTLLLSEKWGTTLLQKNGVFAFKRQHELHL
jgi:hypothetical protein